MLDLGLRQGDDSQATGQLLKIAPRRDDGEGRSPISVDIDVAFKVDDSDVDDMNSVIPGSGTVIRQAGAREGTTKLNLVDTSPRDDTKLKILDPSHLEAGEAVTLFEGTATPRQAKVQVRSSGSSLIVRYRFAVEPAEVAALTARLSKDIEVRVERMQQSLFNDKDKAKTGTRREGAPSSGRRSGAALKAAPKEGDVVRAVKPDGEDTFGQVKTVKADPAGLILTIKDINDDPQEVHVGDVEDVFVFEVPGGQELRHVVASFRNRCTRIGLKPSWAFLILACSQLYGGGQPLAPGGKLVITPEVIDKAVELVQEHTEDEARESG